jgi:hypothetical protein
MYVCLALSWPTECDSRPITPPFLKGVKVTPVLPCVAGSTCQRVPQQFFLLCRANAPCVQHTHSGPPPSFFRVTPESWQHRENWELLLWGVRKFLDVEFLFCFLLFYFRRSKFASTYNRFCILLRVSQVCGLRNLSSKSRRQQVEKKTSWAMYNVDLCLPRIINWEFQ